VISLRFRLPELDNSSSIRKVLRTTGTRYRPFVALAARVAFLALITRYYRTFQWKNTRPAVVSGSWRMRGTRCHARVSSYRALGFLTDRSHE
jgi:hypothetical protein